MSLLSKLLGGKKPTLSEVVDLLQGKEEKPAAQYTRPVEQSRPVCSSYEPYGEPTPIGRSWGERMPDEPNQFNYPGTYIQYFEDIFHTEFAAYRVLRSENPLSEKTTIYTFFDAYDRQVLVVEITAQSADIRKLRRDCERAGMPYLRFYYNHDGWWNARSYVVKRIKTALGIA